MTPLQKRILQYVLFPGKTHVIGSPAGTPIELCSNDEVSATEVELFDHAAAAHRGPNQAITRRSRAKSVALTYTSISFWPPEYDSAQSIILIPFSHAVLMISYVQVMSHEREEKSKVDEGDRAP